MPEKDWFYEVYFFYNNLVFWVPDFSILSKIDLRY